MKKACVIGWPIEHSRSPLIHNHWLQTYGIQGHYDRQAVKPEALEDFLRNLDKAGYAGCNVTVPHKEAALAAADEATEAATAVGAANTLWLEGGRLLATNTDTEGYMAYLNRKAPDWEALSQPVAVLGAGGAARAIIYGLLQAGVPEVRVMNRSLSRAGALQKHFGDKVEPVAWSDRNTAVRNVSLIVNATSLGLNSQGEIELDWSNISDQTVVSDIVYTPLETKLLNTAKARGLKAVDGLGMLLYQAVPGFEKWFGIRPEVTNALYEMIAADVRATAC
jgi:shikimate dehydrogenase